MVALWLLRSTLEQVVQVEALARHKGAASAHLITCNLISAEKAMDNVIFGRAVRCK